MFHIRKKEITRGKSAQCVEGGAEEGNFKGTFAQTVGTSLRASYWSQLRAKRLSCRTLQTQSHRMNRKEKKKRQRISNTKHHTKIQRTLVNTVIDTAF